MAVGWAMKHAKLTIQGLGSSVQPTDRVAAPDDPASDPPHEKDRTWPVTNEKEAEYHVILMYRIILNDTTEDSLYGWP